MPVRSPHGREWLPGTNSDRGQPPSERRRTACLRASVGSTATAASFGHFFWTDTCNSPRMTEVQSNTAHRTPRSGPPAPGRGAPRARLPLSISLLGRPVLEFVAGSLHQVGPVRAIIRRERGTRSRGHTPDTALAMRSACEPSLGRTRGAEGSSSNARQTTLDLRTPGRSRQRRLEAPLADVAPGAGDVRPDVDAELLHPRTLSLRRPQIDPRRFDRV